MSSLAAITSDGLVAHETLTGTTNGEKFGDFLCRTLIPNISI